MKVPISWLKDYVDITIPVEELAEKLTLAGFEVGTVEYIGVPQNIPAGIRMPKSDHLVWDRDKILLGAIKEVKQHPNAHSLVLAMVDYGGDELEQCVTGAPNLFEYADKGELNPPLWTAFAMEGATVWDGHSDEKQLMTLKGKDLRGIYNKSMVCSEKELGISEEHEGIILMDNNPDFVAGTPFQDILGDVILDVELTPNLGHGFSILGVAREAAALTNQPLREPSYDFVAEGDSIEGQAAVDIQSPELNPRFTITLLKNTTVQPSPFWLQLRLKLVGQRPINNVVDITNYITFEIGQPLHAYDYDKLVERAGGAPTLVTKLAEGISIETLDEVKRTVGANQIMVMDEQGALGFGGIIGGAETEISDETKNVLLEAAAWNFINIRKTQQAQKVFTEAGTRFSRNVHPSRAIIGNTRGIELMRQTGGGTIAKGVIDAYPLKPEPVEVALPISEVQRLLGMDISIQEALDVLSRLQFDVTLEGDTIRAVTPDYRTDISTGVVGIADLVEEIARIIGYDKIPTTIMADAMPEQRRNRSLEIEEKVRDLLVILGLTENICYRFTTPEAEAQLIPQGAESSLPKADYITLANPIASDKTVLRHTLLRNLLDNATRNARYNQQQQVFEIGSVYLKKDDVLPEEPRRVAIVMTGLRNQSDWTGMANSEPVDFYDLKGMVEGLVKGLHIENYSITRSSHTTFHPGRSATLNINGEAIGNFGELHPRVASALDLTQYPVFIAELDLDALVESAPDLHGVEALPTAPPVLEDIALVVAEQVPAAEVEAVIRKAGGSLLSKVELFDVYRGDSIPEGHKSLAYALTYQGDSTLSDKQIKKARKSIIFLTEKEVGAKLRS